MLKKIMIRILLSIVSIESVVALSDYDQYLVAANRENLSKADFRRCSICLMTLKDINKTHALLCVANCLSSVPHIYCRKCIIDFWKSSKNLLCPLCGLFVYSKSDVDNFFKYAQNNNPELMRIIDNGININFVDANRRTALMIASKSNCFDNVKMLIELKANLNLRDKYGKTALWYAISHRNLQIIRALIEAGADVNILDNEGDSCLFYAVENYHEILELLLDRLSDINIKNGKGETLLIKAINENSLTSAKLLIERNIDINTQDNLGHTALMHAIVGLKKIFIDLLIANKVDLNVQDHDGNTALMYAIYYSNSYIVEQLKTHISFTNIVDNIFGIVRVLITSGAGINILNKRDYSAVTLWIKNDWVHHASPEILHAVNSAFIKLILDTVYSINRKDILKAIKYGKISIINTLLECGYQPNQEDLVTAIRYKRDDILELFKKRGCVINSKTRFQGHLYKLISKKIDYNFAF